MTVVDPGTDFDVNWRCKRSRETRLSAWDILMIPRDVMLFSSKAARAWGGALVEVQQRLGHSALVSVPQGSVPAGCGSRRGSYREYADGFWGHGTTQIQQFKKSQNGTVMELIAHPDEIFRNVKIILLFWNPLTRFAK